MAVFSNVIDWNGNASINIGLPPIAGRLVTLSVKVADCKQEDCSTKLPVGLEWGRGWRLGFPMI